MSARILLVACTLSLGAITFTAGAQQANKVPVVGLIGPGPHDPVVEGLRQGLRELGYMEGRNISFEFRTDEGQADRLPRLAQELVQLNVDVIVVLNTPAALAVKRALVLAGPADNVIGMPGDRFAIAVRVGRSKSIAAI